MRGPATAPATRWLGPYLAGRRRLSLARRKVILRQAPKIGCGGAGAPSGEVHEHGNGAPTVQAFASPPPFKRPKSLTARAEPRGGVDRQTFMTGRTRRISIVLLLGLVVVGCGSSSEEPLGVGTAREVQELDKATTAPTGSSSTTAAAPVADAGEPAVWTINEGDPPTEESETFRARVSQLQCGPNTEILEPTLALHKDEVVVTFAVASLPPGIYTCEGQGVVEYLVDLGEPLGDRDLIDGTCRSDGNATPHCIVGATRWRPEAS